jgi:hypothetical protein
MTLTDTGYRTILRISLLAVVVLLLLNYLFAELAFRRAHWRGPLEENRDTPPTLTAPVMRAAFLNYETLAADLSFIGALTYYGERLRTHREPKYLYDRAKRTVRLDDRFYHVYEWFPASYLNSRTLVSTEDIERTNRFLDRGIERFPSRYELPYMAGMNYVGYSADASRERRIRELERAIDYLERASMLEGSPAVLPMTVAWMYRRKRQLASEKREDAAQRPAGLDADERDFYATMYLLAEDESTRQAIRAKLERSGGSAEAILERARRLERHFRRAHERRWTFVPPDLWTFVVHPEPGHGEKLSHEEARE